jgi:hypothetical protein
MYYWLADRSEGVATSPLPQGPFSDATPVEGAHLDGIDPALAPLSMLLTLASRLPYSC